MPLQKTETASGHLRTQAHKAATLLKQISDPTRVLVMLLLSEQDEIHAGAISEYLNQNQPATSHHLALLRHGGLVSTRRAGQNTYYLLTDRGETLAAVLKDLID